MADTSDDLDDENEDGPIAVDCPCIRCGYNLRGLLPEGACPECSCPIAHTLAAVGERVLCPMCLASVQPWLPNCPKCGGPMNGSSSITGLAAGQIQAPVRISDEGKLRPAPLAPVILIWVFLAPMAVPVTLIWITALREVISDLSPGGVAGWLLMGALVAVLDFPLFWVTRAYIQRRKLPTGDEDDDAGPGGGSPSEPD